MKAERDAGEVHNPYAAPGSESEPEEDVAVAGYRRQGRLAQLVGLMLGVQALAAGFNALACAGLFALGFSVETEEQLVDATGIAAKFNQVAYIVGLVPFAMFLFRSNKNARVFADAVADGSSPRRQPVHAFSPASMVWWFAVPFLSLFKPYQAVRAVWFNSAPERGGFESAGGGSAILTAWWASWIISLVFSRISTIFTRDGADPGTHNLLVALDAAIGLTAALCAARMILALEQRQARRAAELAAA